MPGVFDRMPEKLTQMQHLLSEDMLHLRGEVGQIVLQMAGPSCAGHVRRVAPKSTRLRQT